MNEFNLGTKIYFGNDSLQRLSQVENKKVMIVCDKFIETSGMVKKVEERLTNCETVIFSDIVPDPPVEIIAQGIQVLNEFNAQVIIAIGGGSSIDAAKAINEYLKRVVNSNYVIEDFIAIPTTSGTGSEVTEYAVITNRTEGLKYALADKSLLPTVAILAPSLVASVPKSITADTGMDVITHALEAYVANGANDFTDAMAEKALTLAFRFLPQAYENGGNLEAREKVHNASCLAGIAFNAAGLGITHSLAHAIGGKLHVPHGRSNAIILPHVVEYNANIKRDSFVQEYSTVAKKYQRIAKILNLRANTVSIGVNSLIKAITDLQAKLSIPTTFNASGVDMDLAHKSKGEIINAAMNDICTKANPRHTNENDLSIIFDKIIG